MEKNLSQEELSYKCVIPTSQTGRFERGERSPKLNTIRILEGGLGEEPTVFSHLHSTKWPAPEPEQPEADIQRHFKTSPPSVHNMIVQLEKKGFIERKPWHPRSIKLLLSKKELPELE